MGLKYIAQPGRHISERIFWSLATFLSSCAAVLILKGAYSNYENKPVSFVCDSSYLHWDTEFPAISLCELPNTQRVSEVRERIYGKDSNPNIYYYLKDIAFFQGTCDSCVKKCFREFNCSNDFKKIVAQTRLNLTDLIQFCMWDGKRLDCSKIFIRTDTELGPCYTFNSLNSMKWDEKKYVSNRTSGLGRLRLRIYPTDVRVFIHPKEDLPFFNANLQPSIEVNGYETFRIKISVHPIENEPGIKDVPISKRNCRFTDENYLKYRNWYSYSGCIEECRLNHTIRLCNCTSHFQPQVAGIPMCNITQIGCIAKHQDYLRKLKSPGEVGFECSCLGTCVEPDYEVVKTYTYERSNPSIAIELNHLPSFKYYRKVVRHKLELVVSMGGTAGLFLGASLLSIVELFYFLFMRKCDENEVEKIENKRKKKRKIKNNRPLPWIASPF